MSGKSSTKTVIASLAVISTMAAVLAYQKRKHSLLHDADPNECVVPMLPFETSSMMMENVRAISSLTWYPPGNDVQEIAQLLRTRIRKILEANPWLLGRLRTRQQTTSIVYSKETTISENDIDKIFTIANNVKITKELSYRDLMTCVEPLLVEKGNNLLNKTKVFFRISIVPEAEGNGFAMITSLAHCVGDGQTYYALHNMLSVDAPIVPLNVHRKLEMTQQIESALGGKEQASSFDPNFGFIIRFIRGIIASSLAGPLSTSVKLFVIPQDWIEEQKQKSSSTSTTSTNDIITSHFFQTLECDQAIMAVNFRGKIPNCNAQDAGNYFQQLILRPYDFQSPSRIRSIVQELQSGQPRNPQTIPMTSMEHIKSRQFFGAISNWSKFSKPVFLQKGIDQTLHIPLLPTDPLSVPSRFTSGLFVFRPDTTKKVAALFAGHPKVLEELEKKGMVGDDVSSLL